MICMGNIFWLPSGLAHALQTNCWTTFWDVLPSWELQIGTGASRIFSTPTWRGPGKIMENPGPWSLSIPVATQRWHPIKQVRDIFFATAQALWPNVPTLFSRSISLPIAWTIAPLWILLFLVLKQMELDVPKRRAYTSGVYQNRPSNRPRFHILFCPKDENTTWKWPNKPCHFKRHWLHRAREKEQRQLIHWSWTTEKQPTWIHFGFDWKPRLNDPHQILCWCIMLNDMSWWLYHNFRSSKWLLGWLTRPSSPTALRAVAEGTQKIHGHSFGPGTITARPKKGLPCGLVGKAGAQVYHQKWGSYI